MDGIRTADGELADGRWELAVTVWDTKEDVTVRVSGDMHIGGVLLQLVEAISKCCSFLRTVIPVAIS